jgi:hypothetical protein
VRNSSPDRARIESLPLHTELIGQVFVTVIRVAIEGRDRHHQVYAVAETGWALVGIFGNYTDEVLRAAGVRRMAGQPAPRPRRRSPLERRQNWKGQVTVAMMDTTVEHRVIQFTRL